MQAVSFDRTGPSSVLTIGERPVPKPDAGEVLVRVVVSGVNPTDWKFRQGAAGPGTVLPAAQVPNQDGAGVIEEVGPEVADRTVGQPVWLWDAAWQRTEGTAQEYVVLPAAQAVPLPAGESFDTGASLGIPALTAHRTLTAREDGPARLAPHTLDGSIVLVSGGAGAVGHAAIQLAVWAGATVITTVSDDRKAALARAAGAQHVINYREPDTAGRIRALAPDGVNLIVEVNVAANLGLDLDVIAIGGTISIYASGPDDPIPVPLRLSMTKNVRYQFILTYVTTPEQKQNAVAAVGDALAAGHLRVGPEHGLPITRFPLTATAAAHDAVENGTIGKVLIDVPTPLS